MFHTNLIHTRPAEILETSFRRSFSNWNSADHHRREMKWKAQANRDLVICYDADLLSSYLTMICLQAHSSTTITAYHLDAWSLDEAFYVSAMKSNFLSFWPCNEYTCQLNWLPCSLPLSTQSTSADLMEWADFWDSCFEIHPLSSTTCISIGASEDTDNRKIW